MPEVGAWTVRRILEWTTAFFDRKEVEPARLSAELLLAHVLASPRIKLYIEYDRVLSEQVLGAYRALVQRAANQEPIAYLTGRAHFFNLEFDVTRDVLIPRPDTETLVENVLQTVRHQSGLEAPRILDLCTGSGCVAAAIAHHLKSGTVVGTDISPAAVAIARQNVQKLGLVDRVTIEEGDLFEPISRLVDPRPFQIIVSNPPYIPTNQIETLDRSVRDYEPIGALDGGLDGLNFHRRILSEGTDRLVSGGYLFLEIAFDQGEAAMQLAAEHQTAFHGARLLKDFAGHDRVLAARRTGG
jgi:release factor glutamine methyltransferase